VLQAEGKIPADARTVTWRYELVSSTYALLTTNETDNEPQTQWLEGDAESAPIPVAANIGSKSTLAIVQQYLVLGFTHIAPKGLDHILFVLGIFLLQTKVRTILVQVTAFTIAHSITLALTMYGVISLTPRVVEPMIALSIAYVAIENILLAKLTPWRPVVVFLFGLLHGMGFAGVLAQLGLPHDEIIPALVSFNVGIEIGQLTVITAAFLAVALWFRNRPWYRFRIVIPASAAIAAIGLFWTVQRVAGA
jgi:hypothetical protein